MNGASNTFLNKYCNLEDLRSWVKLRMTLGGVCVCIRWKRSLSDEVPHRNLGFLIIAKQS